jgi:uncharacterized protein
MTPRTPPRRHTNTKRNRWIVRALAAPLIALFVTGWTPPASAQGHSFLWKATKGENLVYLVGSVHLLTKDYYPLSPAMEAAYKDSALLVEEVDMGEMLGANAQMQLLGRGMLPAGQSLDTVVSPATMALVNKTVAELGVPVEALKTLKPWMAALMLDGLEWQKAGFDAELGLDKHFYDNARADGRQVQGLETVEYQLSMFDGMTLEQQDHMLSESIKELGTEQQSVTTVANAWRAGDAPGVERIVLQDLKSDPVMYQRLLVERNRNWLPKIEALFGRPRPSLVVVGAAHLIGPDGLLQMLKAKGYSVEQF